MLDVVDLTDRADDKVGGYSYGMRQRLGVAASLLRDPRLLVLDEPANGLDPAGIRDMRALVKRLADSGLTVLLSSHHMDEVEEICDNVTIMSRGTVAFHGTIADLRADGARPGPPAAAPATTPAASSSPAAAPRRHGRARRRRPALVVTGPARRAVRLRRRPGPAPTSSCSRFTPTQTPLEALFFMLTDTETAAPRPAELGAR